jgi:hypothetical protein
MPQRPIVGQFKQLEYQAVSRMHDHAVLHWNAVVQKRNCR